MLTIQRSSEIVRKFESSIAMVEDYHIHVHSRTFHVLKDVFQTLDFRGTNQAVTLTHLYFAIPACQPIAVLVISIDTYMLATNQAQS